MQVKLRVVDYYKTPFGRMPAKEWLDSIKDKLTQAILYKRIRQAGMGNLGKIRHVGDGVHEMKINFGPGYRLYYGIYKDELILILFGGSKRTQQGDIRQAASYWVQWKDLNDEKK